MPQKGDLRNNLKVVTEDRGGDLNHGASFPEKAWGAAESAKREKLRKEIGFDAMHWRSIVD